MRKKLTYSEVEIASRLLVALPLDVTVRAKGEDEYNRSLSGKLTGRVLSLIANLNLHKKKYKELEEEARKASISEDFDERFQAYEEKRRECMKEGYIERLQKYIQKTNQDPTYADAKFEKEREEYLNKWEEKRDLEFEKEVNESNSKFSKAVAELQKQEIELTPALFSRKEYEEIISHTEGAEIIVGGEKVSRLAWLIDVEQFLVEHK